MGKTCPVLVLAVVGVVLLAAFYGRDKGAEAADDQGSAAAAAVADEASAQPAATSNTEAALQQASKESKHLVVLAWSDDDETTQKLKALLAEARESLADKALFHEVSTTDADESSFVEQYGLAEAPLPIILVFAPNGAVVGAHVQKVVDEKALVASFASPKLAEVYKLLQDRKLVLLCVQSKTTKYNAESLSAAQAAAADARANDQFRTVQLDPADSSCSDLATRIGVSATVEEAAIYIIVPPGTIAGEVKGATTPTAAWDAIIKALSACSGGGCGPGGCG